MAIKKDITSLNGITSNYHRITHISVNISENDNNEQVINSTCTVKSYISKEFRDKGSKLSTCVKNYSFDLTLEESEGNIRQVAYSKLKELPEFKDAEDC